jgi:hypothetical protein
MMPALTYDLALVTCIRRKAQQCASMAKIGANGAKNFKLRTKSLLNRQER